MSKTNDSAPRLSIDDVRHHAQEVRDLARQTALDLAEENTTRAIVIGAAVVVGALCVAYYLGTHSVRRRLVEG